MEIVNQNNIQIVLGLLSALVLFLFSIENLSNEIQEVASEKFRKIISKLVSTSWKGTLVGALATAITQSSSAVTVIAVVLVNTGIISFRNSLGIIFGSNIGTTITAQLALINSVSIAYILIILGSLLNVLGKKFKIISKPIFFLGLILFALNFLTSFIEPLKNDPNVMYFFSHLSNPLLAYLFSAIFTMIIHSSSVTSGITVVLVQGGVIPVEVGIPMILGANIGSSITALIASMNLNLFAKRAGFANFLFNAIGTILFMIFLPHFIQFMQYVVNVPAQQVALAHLFFNLFNTIVFLLLLVPFEKLVSWIIRGDEEEVLFKTKYIQKGKRKKLEERFLDIKQELAYSIENSIKIYQKAISIFYNPSSSIMMDIKKLETLNDYLDDEITSSIVSLSKYKLSERDARNTVVLIKVSNTIEQIADLGSDFSEIFGRMHNLGLSGDDLDIEKLTDIHNRLIDLFRDIEKAIQGASEKELLEIKVHEEEIYSMIRGEFDIHVAKLQKEDKYNGNVFVDAISVIELSVSKVRDIRKILLKYVREY